MKPLERIRHYAPILLIAAAAFGAGAGILYMKNAPPKYEASIAFTVDHRELQKPDDYAYDGFYALRAAEIFADTVVSWFRTPSVHARIRELAGPTADEQNIGLPKELDIDVKKFAGQNVVATITSLDRERTELITRTTIGVITAKAKELNRNADGEPQFMVSAENPVFEERRVLPLHAGLIGGLLGAVLAAVLLFLITPPKKKNDR